MKKYGWTRRFLHKKRVILYVGVRKGFFTVSFIFGGKAQTAVENSNLPESIKTSLRESRQYMEGKGLRLDVK
jgi:hypothetical protein